MRQLTMNELHEVSGATTTVGCPVPPPSPTCPVPQAYLDEAARQEFNEQFLTGSSGDSGYGSPKG